MIKVFKWWWAWEYEKIEDWLEKMEASGLRLVKTRFKGLYFYLEKCSPTKARYCIDFQTKLTPEYVTIINDDGWKLYQIGMGWYLLRKEYSDERPNLYTDFEALVARNKKLLTLMIIGLFIEMFCIGNLIWEVYKFPTIGQLATTCILGSFVIAFFVFCITSISMQISKFSKRN